MSRAIGFRTITVTVAAAGTAVQVTSDRIVTPFIEVHFPVGNGGVSYIGDETVDSAWVPRAADSTHRWSASEKGDLTHGDYFDLSKIYIDAATSADTAIVQYLAPEE